MRPGFALIAAAALVLLALPGPAPANNPPDKIFPMPYEMRTLDNGLRVIIVPVDTPGVVSVQIPVQTGSRNEVEKGKSGFAHFFEHMMFRGTPDYPPAAYQAIIKDAGADQNAYTSSDLTNYYTNFTTTDLEKILEIEADRFQSLKYTEDQFRTEALAVKGEYLKNYSNPISKGFERLSALAFDVHTYGHTTMGYIEDIDDMPNQMDYASLFFDRWYRPEYTSVIVVGDVEPQATMRLVEKYWGDWQRGSYSVDIPQEPVHKAPRQEHMNWEGGTTLPYIIHSWHGPAMHTDSRTTPALMLLAEIWFGDTSSIYQELVVRENLVDQFSAYPPMNKDPSLFNVLVRLTDPAHAPKVTQAIRDTLLQARTQPVDEAQLQQVKSRVKYGFAAGLDSAQAIGGTLARWVHYERTPETLNQLYQQFDQVTAQDIIDAADQVFADANRVSLSLANGESLPGALDFAALDPAVAKARDAVAELPTIKVIAQPSQSPLVDVALLFDTGAAWDPPAKAGLASLTVSMLTEGGTLKRNFAELQDAFYPLASGLSGQVDKHVIKLSGTVHQDNLQTWHELVREMLLQPGFREDDFARVKMQLVNAIRVNLRANNDEELGKEALYEMVYGADHPYGRLNLGHASELEALTLDDVRAFYREHFNANRVRVGLAGNYGETFQDSLVADLQQLPQGSATALTVAAVPLAEQRKVQIIEKETPAVAVSFGWPIQLKRSDPDWAALWLVRSYLGEHRNSGALLYQRIREERGMNYGDYAYIEYFPNGMYLSQPRPNYPRHNDLFQVWLRPLRNNNDALFATRTALFELDRLIRDGIPTEQFEATRNFLDKYVTILTAASSARLGHALDSDWFGTTAFADHVRSELAKLTPQRVNEVIRRYLKPEAAQFVFVARDAKGLADALAGDQTSPISYNSEKDAELLAEDEVIERMPLHIKRGDISIIPGDRIFE